MSSIIFSDLVNNVIFNSKIKAEIESLVQKKGIEPEKSTLEVPLSIYQTFVDIFESLVDPTIANKKSTSLITNENFRELLNAKSHRNDRS